MGQSLMNARGRSFSWQVLRWMSWRTTPGHHGGIVSHENAIAMAWGSLIGLILSAWTLSTTTMATEFAQADTPREFTFPRDHASHPEFKTEWWYITGVLETAEGELFGYQATWFRSGLKPEIEPRASQLGTRDLFFFHGALTDVSARRFQFDQAVSRGASTWAGADVDQLRVSLLQNTLTMQNDGTWRLRFEMDGHAVDLTLAPERPALLHGEEAGLSQKGPICGQASYYYSQTRMRTLGTISRRKDNRKIEVSGHSWFDHEFGSNQLGKDQVGWDWFSVPLDDGSDLMLYLLRKKDGSVENTSSGTFRDGAGNRVHLARADFSIDVLDHWTSTESGGRYPAAWRLRVPRLGIDLEVRPVLPDQELHTAGTTGVTYWEGLCEFRGQCNGKTVLGRGYVELVGYAGEFLGRI